MLYASPQVFGITERQVAWGLAHFHIDLSRCLKFMVYQVGACISTTSVLVPPRPVPPCLALPCPVPVGRESGRYQLQLPPSPACTAHHQQVIEEEHLSLVCGLFLELVHVSHLEEPATADQAAVWHGQHLEPR